MSRESLKRLLRILASVGLLAMVIWLADWRAVIDVLRTVDPRWVILAVGLAAVDRIMLNYRWQVLLAARGVLIGFLRLFRVQLAANFIGSFLPSSMGVDAVRIAALCRAGEPTAVVIAATLVDRATIVMATFLFGSAAILMLAEERIPARIERIVLIATLLVLIAASTALLPAVRRQVRRTLLPRMPERFAALFSAIADASLAFRRDGRTLANVATITLVLFGIRILFAKVLGLACGVDIPFATLALIMPILWIFVMLPITIGGLGVQDVGYVALLALAGVGAPVAVSMSLIEHIVTRAVSLPGAFLMGTTLAKP